MAYFLELWLFLGFFYIKNSFKWSRIENLDKRGKNHTYQCCFLASGMAVPSLLWHLSSLWRGLASSSPVNLAAKVLGASQRGLNTSHSLIWVARAGPRGATKVARFDLFKELTRVVRSERLGGIRAVR